MCDRHRRGYHQEYHQQHYVPVANPKPTGRPKIRDAAHWREYQRNYQRQYQREKTQRLRAYKAAQGCADCGENDPIVLDFDHVRGEKSFDIGHALGAKGWSTLLKEIEKCDVVCANCHRRRTALRRELGGV